MNMDWMRLTRAYAAQMALGCAAFVAAGAAWSFQLP
jgi:hypothetical protein